MPLLEEATEDFEDQEPDFTQGEDFSWQEDALCAQVGYEPFFQGKGGQGYSDAKRVCRMCPAVQACLSFALRTRQDTGCWGATSPDERLALRQSAA